MYIVSPSSLAKAGLYFTGPLDRVECAFCHGKLEGWEAGDDATIEHSKHFGSRCNFVKKLNVGNVPLTEEGGAYVAPTHGITLRDIMESPAAMQVLTFGVERDVLERAAYFIAANSSGLPGGTTLLEACTIVNGKSSCNQQSTSNMQPQPPAMNTAKESKKTECKKEKENEEQMEHEAYVSKELETRFKELQQSRTCKICLDEDINVVFLPCGHLVCCTVCAPALNRCPICRANIREVVKTYLA
jgi:hypothetical protein